ADTSVDEILTMLINASSVEIAGFCQRVFKLDSYTEYYQGDGDKRLLVDNYPIIAVESVKIGDEELTAGQYRRKDKAGILEYRPCWPKGKEIEIEYTAGYVLPQDAIDEEEEMPLQTLPADIEMACMELVSIAYNKRGSEHLTVEVIGSLRSEFIQGMPQHIQAILTRYRKSVI
uniref:hypothetical protein n=1 Tax=Anaerospora hongkongensis TaxID=244830 RepID=UPI002FDB2840